MATSWQIVSWGLWLMMVSNGLLISPWFIVHLRWSFLTSKSGYQLSSSPYGCGYPAPCSHPLAMTTLFQLLGRLPLLLGWLMAWPTTMAWPGYAVRISYPDIQILNGEQPVSTIHRHQAHCESVQAHIKHHPRKWNRAGIKQQLHDTAGIQGGLTPS